MPTNSSKMLLEWNTEIKLQPAIDDHSLQQAIFDMYFTKLPHVNNISLARGIFFKATKVKKQLSRHTNNRPISISSDMCRIT